MTGPMPWSISTVPTIRPKAALFFARETICAIEGAALMMRIYKDPDFLRKANDMILKNLNRPPKRPSYNSKSNEEKNSIC